MSYYIYRMTHTPTGRTYIGQRKMPKGCLCPYLDKYNGSGVVWRQIFKAHPGECSKEVLDVAVSKADIDRLEIRYIADERAVNPEGCVNIAVGGDGWDGPRAEETKRKISEAKKGHAVDDTTRDKISKSLKGNIPWNKGKRMTQEYRDRLSEAHKGERNHLFGKHLSEETKRKMSEAHKIRWARKKALTVNN